MTITLEARPQRRATETRDPVSLWNPVGFDPRDYLDERLHRYADHARYFLHSIFYGQVFRVGDQRAFVPLKSEYLRRFFPDSRVYRDVRGGLIESGAIVCDDHYVRGEKARGYKLGPALAAMRQHRVVITNYKLAAKIRAHRREWIKTPQGVHRHLFDCLRNVTIDAQAALDWLVGRDLVPSDEVAIQMIRDQEWFFHVCAYGRVHTNLTSLRSDLRGFLTYRGMPLINLDIRNSQPLIFAILLRERFGADALPEDVRLYQELVQAGRLYEHLMEKGGIPAGQRGTFKKQFFGHVFFCRNWPETEAARMFGRLFPSVYAVIRAMKAEDYTALAKRLQRAESDLMIGRVAGRCRTERPGAFLGTIHDSILTAPDEADAIRAIMEAEFARIGLHPTIRVEEPQRPNC